MEYGVSHDWSEETLEAKARWYQSLSLEHRMAVFCSFSDFLLKVNPELIKRKDAQPEPGRGQVLELA